MDKAKKPGARLAEQLRLPVICSPMFIISNPEMVIEQCRSGVVGTFPVLNARPQKELSVWLTRIETALESERAAGRKVAPHGVNLVIRPNDPRFEADLATCVSHKVPVVITSLGNPAAVVQAVHAYGGLVLHDVTSARHARRALEAGVDGLILVCAGAGGHAGALSPFALLREVRAFYDGLIVLAGAITDGRSVLAAQVMGADLAYMGTRFIATRESGAVPEYKAMLVEASATDIIYTPHFSGIPANYLKASLVAAGLDPDNLPQVNAAEVRARGDRQTRWKHIWGAGQGVGNIQDLPGTAELVDRLTTEYELAREESRKRFA
ncbi:NAD(P)H-dependent flavin oxidoreductase [Ottowia thiooxydans]|uniref:NAD(P)H-dependent flavin oxidoreductase n=1 Tax=Ottowia thiooxydans TaxID=219182 RepID=UPI0003FC8FFB|nr:nitronate monooxygenase [Ottowia thiooxydans]